MTATGAAGGIAGFQTGAAPADAAEAILAALGAALGHRGGTDQRPAGPGGFLQLLARADAGFEAAGLTPDGLLVVSTGLPAAVVLRHYASYGLEGIGALGTDPALGWSAAIGDLRTGSLRLVAGTAPLYYAHPSDVTGGAAWIDGIAFASEPAALVRAGVMPAVPDDQRVLEFVLTGGGEDGERTFFAGIHRLAPGHVLEIGSGVPATAAAFPLAGPPQGPVEAPVRASLGAAQRPAVRLGDGLPGAVLAAQAGGSAAVFSASFAPMDTTEDLYAGAVGAALGATVHAVRVNADTLAADLAEFLRVQGEPVADPGLYVQYAVARTAQEGGADRLVDPAGSHASFGLTPTAKGKAARRVVSPASLLRAGLDPGLAGPAPSGAPATGQAGRTPAAALAEVRRAADRSSARAGLVIDTPLATATGGEAALRALLPAGAPGDVRPSAPLRDWLLRLKNRIYGTFLAESFVNRPWFAQQAVLVAFEDFIKGRNADAALFWRVWSVEVWAQEFFDPKPEEAAPVHVKGPLEANANKRLQIAVTHGGREEQWLRFPVRTELFTSGQDYGSRISAYISGFVAEAGRAPTYAQALTRPWYLLVSEKIIAISQGRSYFIWDIEPSWWARTLSKFVVKTPYGIGLGSPWTMELAIKEAGLARILFAAGVSAAGKAVGKRGLFYQVAGHSVRAIDGPTEYSVYPANVSAKLAPAHPGKVASQLRGTVGAALKEAGFDAAAGGLAGVVVIDANDIGRNVLGADADRPDVFFEELFGDNPLGQGSEQTPLAVAVQL